MCNGENGEEAPVGARGQGLEPLRFLQALRRAPHHRHSLSGFLQPFWLRGQACSCKVCLATKGPAEGCLQKCPLSGPR